MEILVLLSSVSDIYGLITDPHQNQLPVGLIVEWVHGALHRHRRGQGSNSCSGLSLGCLSSVKTLR